MTANRLVHSILKLTAIAGVLAAVGTAPGWAQETSNSQGQVVDGHGHAGNSNNGYDWANGAVYYQPPVKRTNQLACPTSGAQRSASCLHRQRHAED